MTKPAPIEKTASSWSDLQDVLRSLETPAAGTHRVYRGQTQTRRHEKSGLISLLPVLSRPGRSPEYDPLWFSRAFITLTKDEIPPDFWVHQLWLPALLQHYGPGSSFLDVTSNLDTALWFALHDRSERWTTVQTSPDGKQFTPHAFCTCWYTRSRKKLPSRDGPVLLVFDVKPWHDGESIRHGSLVSLQSSPWGDAILNSATRLKAQDGHLIYSDVQDPTGPDLSSILTAIVYLDGISSWPDAAKTNQPAPASRLFPSPDEDPFYRLLLDTPSRVTFSSTHPERPRLEHPLMIPCYLVNDPPFWEDSRVSVKSGKGDRLDPAEIGLSSADKTVFPALKELQKYTELSSQLSPLLFHRFLLENLSLAQPKGGLPFAGAYFELDKATPFLLECPLWDVMPAVAQMGQQGLWIESALVQGIPDTVAGRPTNSFYLETSNLESWTLEGGRPGHIRGVWILRQHPYYSVTVYFMSDKGPAAVTQTFEYQPREGCFVWQDTRSAAVKASRPLTQAGIESIRQFFLKGLFIGLTLLRDLSPQLKPPPYHLTQTDNAFFPATFLETKCANIIEEGPFLVPKSLNGGAYVHSLGQPDVNPTNEDEANVWVNSLKPYLNSVRDPYYLSMAGKSLAEIYFSAGQRDMAAKYIDWAMTVAAQARWADVTVQSFKELKDRIDQAN